MENQESKVFKKKTELVFTTIEIESIVKNRKYVAKFQAGKETMHKISISGISVKECIEKTSQFLECEINEKHYKLINC